MQEIKRLSKHVANLIAAGEVVERPASVVKELVENSIDAGASVITVEIRNGGVSYIRVTDNGSGISANEIETAFLRFATSKIFREEDLESIRTMGFRGEALAAIAAVSKSHMLTKTKEARMGKRILLEGGVVIEKSEAGCPQGTTVTVCDLFYNTPARHKFLKKDSTEAGYVQSVCTRAAMSRPDISFKVIKDGEVVVHTPGDGSLHSVIYCLYGKELISGLIEIDYKLDNCHVGGFVSTPAAARRSRTMQHFMINGRPIKNLMLQSAVEEAFKSRLVTGRFPACFLNISVPEESVDVNVHPSKTEVKFAFERRVFETVYYGIKGVLEADSQPEKIILKHNEAAWALSPEKEKQDYELSQLYKKESMNTLQLRSSEVFVKDVPQEDIYKKHNYSTDNRAIIKPTSTPMQVSKPETNTQGNEGANEEIPNFCVLGEVFKLYILVSSGDKLLLVDKHAAHERQKYEELKQNLSCCAPQAFLEPPVVSLSAQEKAIILENRELLLHAGFDIEDFGGFSVIVRGMPGIYESEDVQGALCELAAKLENRHDTIDEKLDKLLRMIACKSSIKSGDNSDKRELESLVSAILRNKNLRNCPHGRPIIASLDKSELEKYFKRTV